MLVHLVVQVNRLRTVPRFPIVMRREGAVMPGVVLLPLPGAAVKIGNAPLTMLLRSPLHGIADGGMLVLRFRGRRTGTQYRIPVPYHRVGGVLSVLSGRAWRFNMRGGTDVEVVLAGKWVEARAELVEDPQEVARTYAAIMEAMGGPKRARRLGLKLADQSVMPSEAALVDALGGRRAIVRIYPNESSRRAT